MNSKNADSYTLKATVKRNSILALMIIMFIVGAIILFYRFSTSEKRANILISEELASRKSADNIELFLSSNTDSVKLVAYTLDEMLITGKSDEDIQDFLVRQSAAKKSAIDPDSTGFYGYINGRFFSGLNWIPPEGYDATIRPWYTKPFDDPENVTILDPYLDLETGIYKLALGKVLVDGKSVVSMDLPFTPIQLMVEKAVKDNDIDMCMVISDENLVIAHSDRTEVGRDYDEEIDTLGAMIARNLQGEDDYSFEFTYGNADYIVYVAYIQGGFKCITANNATVAYKPLRWILAATVAIIAFIIAVALYMLYLSMKAVNTSEIPPGENITAEKSPVAKSDSLLGRLINSGNSTPLSTKIHWLVFTVLIVAEVLICTSSIVQSRNAVRTSVQQRMLDIANCASGAVDGDLLIDIKAEDEGTKKYQQIYDALAVFRDNVEVEYVYGIRAEKDGRFTFTVDPTIIDPGEFGSEVKNTDALYQASQGIPSVDEVSYTDAWGSFYSAYSPVLDSKGNIAGIIGVDFSADWFDGQMNYHTQQILITYLIIFVLTTILSWLLSYVLIRTITEPLIRMSAVAVRYEKGDYSERIEMDRGDEIGVLSHTLQEMAGSLQEQIIKANEANEAKSIFLANMSHEIRTPINAILGMTEMILRETKESKIRSYATNAKNAGKDLIKLINAIPNFSNEVASHVESDESANPIPNFIAPNARILVVDDNAININVFSNLIESIRVQLDSAESGDKALELMAKNKYDLIFLDHMMPEKDGIETLHEMKALEDCINKDTPVICLTANAIKGAKEFYLSKGFDDYLTKPIDPAILNQFLMNYIPEEKIILQADEEKDIPEKETETDNSALSWLYFQNVIDHKEGLKNNGSEKAYLSILKAYYDQMDSTAKELEDLYHQNDIERYTIKVHALKSSSRLIGAMDLGEKAQELENAGKSQNIEYIDNNHRKFISEYLSLKDILKPAAVDDKALESEDDKPVADESRMNKVFCDLKAAAEDMDTIRIDEIFDEMNSYRVPEKYAELYNKVKAVADEFDYSGITELLQEEV